MKYEYLIIYYFSGTGNARNAASWIINIAEEKGIKTHFYKIDRSKIIDSPPLSANTLIGFCTPTHGFNIPPLVLNFIWKFPPSQNTDVFILNTRAGLKLSKLFVPGLSGVAQFLPAIILRLKGYRVVGMQPLDLPSNWILLHPGLREKVINSIYERCRRIVNRFTVKLLDGKKQYKAIVSFPIDILLAPVALGYYIFGRFFLAKTLMASNACTTCKLCIKQCPVGAIKEVDNRPFWTYRCESCMRCINTCPERAIETMQGFAILLLLLSPLVISPLLIAGLKYLGMRDLIHHSALTENIWSLIDAFIFLVFVFISYGLLHYLMRYKLINAVITYTSLSTYRFWRRYKAPRQLIKSQNK